MCIYVYLLPIEPLSPSIPLLQVITDHPVKFPVLFSSFQLSTFFTHARVYIREGNDNPPQYSCLENPRDGNLVVCHLWGHTESDTTDVTAAAAVYICQCYSICSTHPFPLCVHKSMLYVCLYPYPENKFFSTIFLYFIYMH